MSTIGRDVSCPQSLSLNLDQTSGRRQEKPAKTLKDETDPMNQANCKVCATARSLCCKGIVAEGGGAIAAYRALR